MLLARKAKKSWHGTYMPGKAGLLLPWLPRKSSQGRAFQGWVAEVAPKARLWLGLTGFSRPYFSGKPGQKPGKPGLAGLLAVLLMQGYNFNSRQNILLQFPRPPDDFHPTKPFPKLAQYSTGSTP